MTEAGADAGPGAPVSPAAVERAEIIISRAASTGGPVLLAAGVTSSPAPFTGVAGWWLVIAGAASLAVLVALPVSWWAPRVWIRRVFTAIMVLAPLATLTYDAASVGDAWVIPWTWALEPLAIGAAIVVLPVRWAFSYAVASVLSVPALTILAGSHPEAAWWGTVGLHASNIVFVALIDAMRTQLRRQYTAGERARATAEARALALAWQEERTRVDGVVHDEVLSTLLAGVVATPATREAVGDQAGQTLALLERWKELDVPVAPTSARATATGRVPAKDTAGLTEVLHLMAEDSDAHFSASGPGLDVPAGVARLVAAATRQALRNCQLHAPGAAVSLDIDTSHGILLVTVADSGPGFDPADIPPLRLGIRVGIVGRMGLVRGGSAQVLSEPGAGTRVLLTWRPPVRGPHD